ncbi:MAG TPA: DUF1365 family protein [Caballeronia sp.]|nr:DUF1365 family protein [Caballeronia sp.]
MKVAVIGPGTARLAQGTQRHSRWFSKNQFGLLSFYDSDHGTEGQTPLEWIESMLHENGIHDATGEIFLHSLPRVLGYVFNPVSFWFREHADGTLRAVVCEVNNTFGERHCRGITPSASCLHRRCARSRASIATTARVRCC